MYTLNMSALTELVEEARIRYLEVSKSYVTVFSTDAVGLMSSVHRGELVLTFEMTGKLWACLVKCETEAPPATGYGYPRGWHGRVHRERCNGVSPNGRLLC